MFKLLPKILILSVLLFAFFTFLPRLNSTHAQELSPSPSQENSGRWVEDSEVTFVGKSGARSGEFLDWTLQNYQWLTLVDGRNPLIPFWTTIRNIVYAFVALFVLATAFIIIVTRGQNITVMRFIPRFIFIVVLITLSFSLVQFIYLVNDIIQDFFLKIDNRYISTQDLLYIGFDYASFLGYRKIGPEFDESAFISLMLVRLTAITYYVMTGLLLVRKIILWFFIIISPVFPLLIFYKPIRNTAKIWLGEFFRWLFYAPLFAIFLQGLVVMWRAGIPLPFDFSGVAAGEIVYPTAINILLGGPGQAIGINNSVNLRDTFALYVVALLMLWVVILLPFLLLKIFLDYIGTLSLENNLVLKKALSRGANFFGGKGTPPTPPQPPGQFQPAGQARTLPFFAQRQAATLPVQYHASIQSSVAESADVMQRANLSIPRMMDIARFETSLMSKDQTSREQVSSIHTTLQKIANPNATTNIAEREKFQTVKEKLIEQKSKGNPIASSILNASNATATNIAQTNIQNTDQISKAIASQLLTYSNISTQNISNTSNQTEVRQNQINQINKTLEQIAHPERVVTQSEKEKISTIKEQLMREKQKGNKIAESILEASEKVTNTQVTEEEKTSVKNELIEKLFTEQDKVVKPTEQKVIKPQVAPLPTVNKVQQVSLEDYEEVRKMWTENYQTIEPPKALNGELMNRQEWIKNDIDKIAQAISLLSSVEPDRINSGMSMVSSILPFLLIGGFSKSEVIAYLKAKQEAGKQVLTDLSKKEQEEESLVSTKTAHKEEAGTLKAQISQDTEEKTNNEVNPGQLKDLSEMKELGDESDKKQ